MDVEQDRIDGIISKITSALNHYGSTCIPFIKDELSPRELKVISMYYGFDGDKLSIKSIAQYFSVSPSRIRQVKHMAIRRLLKPRLAPYWAELSGENEIL